jgi:hypothetical protein
LIKELEDIFKKANVDSSRLAELIVKTGKVGRQEARIAVLNYSLVLARRGDIGGSMVAKECAKKIEGLE